MKVKEVISAALALAGRDDAARDVLTVNPSEDSARLTREFLAYYNAVIDELARGYFPLAARADLSSEDGCYALSSLPKTAVRINGVTDGKKVVDWRICAGYLCCTAKNITVFYEYVPAAAVTEDDFSYPLPEVGERLVEYGMVSEHFLVEGASDESAAWENKYRGEIDRILARGVVKRKLPARRWV